MSHDVALNLVVGKEKMCLLGLQDTYLQDTISHLWHSKLCHKASRMLYGMNTWLVWHNIFLKSQPWGIQ